MRLRIFRNKKAVMGIGMLMIFIATVLVSSLAAGVLIRATGLLQQRALLVEQSTRERLVSGLEVFAVYAQGNRSAETINEFEFLVRTRAGSPPLQMRTTGLSFVSEDLSFSARLNKSLIGIGACNFGNLTPETEFCYENRIGNTDTVLEEGELLALRYKLKDSNALATEKRFEVTLTPKTGALEILELTTPELVLTEKIRLR